jgi:hypothetical protein
VGWRPRIAGRTARDVLASKGVKPDFEFASTTSGVNLDYMHRRDTAADIYFVSNQLDQMETGEAIFRVSDKAPELWLPDSGEIRPVYVYHSTADGRTAVPVRLPPYGSVFVVFRKAPAAHYVSIAKDGRPAWADVLEDRSGRLVLAAPEPGEWSLRTRDGRAVSAQVPAMPEPSGIPGPWTVRFVAGPGAADAIKLDTLASWTENSNPAVKYFSGTAAYEKEIDIPSALLSPGRRLELDLGDVRELAEVILNGQNLGLVWKMPRTVDLTAPAKVGKNWLRIEVTNLWPNRIIGDQFLPGSQRFTKTNIRKFTKDSPLLPSGLIGPVTLRSQALVTLDRF